MGEKRTSSTVGATRRRRVWWFAAAGFAAGLVALVVSVDWWAPAAGEAWLGRVNHARRVTEAGRAVAWEKLSWEGEGLRLRVDALRVTAPSRLLRGQKLEAEGRGWVLEILDEPVDRATNSGDTDGAWEVWVPRLREAGAQMRRRLGEVRLTEGVMRVAGEEIAVSELRLTGAEASVSLGARGQTLDLRGDFEETRLSVHWNQGAVDVALKAEPDAASGRIAWAGNQAKISARFARGEWLPADVNVRGEGWRVPAETLGLGARGYEDLEGGFALRGEGARFSGTVDAIARPKRFDLPPVQVRAAASGDAAGLRLDRLELAAPQARASLSAPVEWRSKVGWIAAGEPVFAWEADLGALSGDAVRGRTEGTARWTGGVGAGARVRWEAKGTGLTWRHIADATLSMRGETDEGATTVTEAVAEAGGGSRLEARGRLVHETLAVEGGVLRAKAAGALLRPWLPEGINVERVEAELRASGAWPKPEIDGVVRAAKIDASGWASDAMEAKATGVIGERLRGELTARRGEARLAAKGEWTPTELAVAEFLLRRADGAELRAEEPLLLRLAGGGREVAAELAGPDETRLSVAWREGGDANLVIQNLNTGWARDWRSGAALPELTLRRLSVSGRVGEDGVIEGAGEFEASARVASGMAWARGAGRTGRDGARLEKLEAGGVRKDDGAVEQKDAVLVAGSGAVPWRARRGGEAWTAEPVAGARWNFTLESKADAAWWEELAKAANFEVAAPVLRVRVEGEASAPRGVVELGAERVVLRGEGLPADGLELRALRAEAELARDALILRRLEARVDGQRVEAEGRLGVAEGDWAKLRERPYVWLRDHAEARVSVPGAEVSAFARYLPTLLAPQGVVRAELRLSPGARLDGTLGLSGAATRPLGGFGVLQEVEVALALSGMDVRIEKMRAMAGGQEVRVTGGARRVPGRMPALDLAVRAERFPLMRKPGLLLRGDLDLTVKTATDGGRTKVGGEVRLRDSLFLADIRPLLTVGGGRGSEAVRARPPYFSVENPPLADWELGLRVGGLEFLRLRTPVFEGVGSARFDLTGTLREPRAIGEFWVERGNILFPFASFAVQEGAVRLKASDPYTPALEFRATGRRLGYDLRLELGGTADAPQLQLTSSPPLEAETVLLMVTAGTAPTQGAGTASGTQRLAAVGAYVGRDLLRTLGFSGSDEERLTVSSGEKVSRAGRETYGLEFKLNERWSLTGEYDEFDAYNVGVKRRFGPGVGREARENEEKERKEAADAR